MKWESTEPLKAGRTPSGINIGVCNFRLVALSLVLHRARKMRRFIEQSNALAPLSPFRSWPDYITNTSGYDFWKQVSNAGGYHLLEVWCQEFVADTATTSERTGHWIKMRRSLAPSSGPEALDRTQSLGGLHQHHVRV